MSAVKYALDMLNFKIPRVILDAVFIKRNSDWRRTPVNINQQIMDLVIRPRVLTDCNLVGGSEVLIDLARADIQRYNNYVSVIRVPKEMTGGRSIVSAKEIIYSNPYYGVGNQTLSMMGVSSGLNAVDQVLNSATGVPTVSTCELELIAENTIMVRDTAVIPVNSFLRCIIGNDEQMNHIQKRSYRAFAQLVEYAVKAYIYNEYYIYMGQGELSGGQQLGPFKDVVDSYSDANELYDTYIREKWTKIAMMNDQQSFQRHIRLMIGSGH